MSWFKTTQETIARNPIARAVAKQRLAASMRDATIKLYLTPRDEKLPKDVQEAAQVIVTAIRILEQRGQDDPVMRAAMSALTQCAQDQFKWKPQYTVTVDVALQRALQVYRQSNATETQAAYRHVEQLTQEALCSTL